MRERIGALIRAYEEQGFHRSGTAVDELSAEWLTNEIRQIGLAPTREEFTLSRVDPVSASLAVNGRTIEGLPLFDGRSEEHTSELQSRTVISYAVFCFSK